MLLLAGGGQLLCVCVWWLRRRQRWQHSMGQRSQGFRRSARAAAHTRLRRRPPANRQGWCQCHHHSQAHSLQPLGPNHQGNTGWLAVNHSSATATAHAARSADLVWQVAICRGGSSVGPNLSGCSHLTAAKAAVGGWLRAAATPSISSLRCAGWCVLTWGENADALLQTRRLQQ
jgi:hypothetical protein